MAKLVVVGLEEIADLWLFVNHNMNVAWVGIALTVLSVAFAASAYLDRRKSAKKARIDALADAKAKEMDRSNKLVAMLREIGEAKDAVVLEQAVAQGRRLAKKPAPTEYRVSTSGIYDRSRGWPCIPTLDKNDERYLVERQYYGNRNARVPYSWGPYSPPHGFPKEIPKEWLPTLVGELIKTLPARYPSYYSFTSVPVYSEDSAHAVIRRIAHLSDVVEQPYLSISGQNIPAFIAGSYGDHWSELADAVTSILCKQSEGFPSLGADLLHFACSGSIKAYSPKLVGLALIQGVSKSICYTGRRIIPKRRKMELASAYVALLEARYLDGIGQHRLFYDSAYCHLSYSFEQMADEYASVCNIHMAEDHLKGYLSVDRTLSFAVSAMGIVSAESPSDRSSIIAYLPKVINSYISDKDSKRLLRGSKTETAYDVRLNMDCVDDFVDGIYKLTNGRREAPIARHLIGSSELLVPDIVEKLDEIDEYNETRIPDVDDDGIELYEFPD